MNKNAGRKLRRLAEREARRKDGKQRSMHAQPGRGGLPGWPGKEPER